MSHFGHFSAVASSRAEILGRVADEYYSQLNRGERPDIEHFARQHPEVADAIRQVLPALGLLEESDCGDLSGRLKDSTKPAQKTLGDFRIAREIGRGGMGVVYEAEQISMGRTVALKVLPFAAVMDEKAITRFKNEARAAGTLHHDNIVPVHAVGNERGVYYYAMSLIEGLTLAEVVDDLKQHVLNQGRGDQGELLVDQVVSRRREGSAYPESGGSRRFDPTTDNSADRQAKSDEAERETAKLVQAALSTRQSLFGRRFYDQVARIGIQAADALHHAHEHGIVHRDIKPGNLMVDPVGKLWVTDFGLARIESDAGMTMTGDVLGTLRYMAPEQALAKRIVVDHRADIYSLGVTLYELLTLRPVFDGDNRETLFKQLTFEEPKPIRQLQPGVPVDLETIVLKAIAKCPEERYATAAELADDLRAFRECEPIKAKPLSIWQRSHKWASRHQSLVMAAMIVLFVVSIALAGSTIAVSHQKSQTQAALSEAQQQKERAEENFDHAREAVDTYLTRVSEDHLLKEPELQPLRRELLELALQYYGQFTDQCGDDQHLKLEHADALDRVADIRNALGAGKEPVNDARLQALGIRRRLFEQDPSNDEYRNALAESYRFPMYGTKFAEDVERLEQSIELARPLKAPEHRLTLAGALADLSKVLHLFFQSEGGIEKMERSRELLVEAIEIFEELQDQNVVDGPFLMLPKAYQQMAGWHATMGNQSEVNRFDQQALEQLQRLDAAHPAHVEIRQALADSYVYHGMWDQAIEIREALANENPFVTSFQTELAKLYRAVGTYRQREDGRENEAVELSAKGLEIFKRLADTHPTRTDVRSELAVQYKKLASAMLSAGRLDEAIENAQSAINILSETGAYTGELADAYLYLSRAHQQAERWDQAIEALEGELQVASELSADQLHFQKTTALNRNLLGELLLKVGRIDEAVAEFQRAVSVLEDSLSSEKVDGTPFQVMSARVVSADNSRELAIVLHDLGRHDEAAHALGKAIKSIEPLFDGETSGAFAENVRLLAMDMSSELLRTIAEDSSNQAARASLRELLQSNLEAELEQLRSSVAQPSEDEHGWPPNHAWLTWSQLVFRGYVGLDWKGAEREARRSIELAPHYPSYALAMAPLLLLAGEKDEYRQLCIQLLDAGSLESAEKQTEIDNWIVRLCGLDPQAAGDPDRIVELAQKGMTAPDDAHYCSFYALGRAYYRAGKFEKAIESLEHALTQMEGQAGEPLVCLDLALAHHYWDKDEKAQEWFGRARELLGAGDLTLQWHELAETTVLRHEVERLLGQVAAQKL